MTERTLYDTIEKVESQQRSYEFNVKELERIGFKIDASGGRIPDARGKAVKFLNDQKYEENQIIQYVLVGGKLSNVVGELSSEMSYDLKMPWRNEDRKEHNKKVKELGDLLPRAGALKMSSMLNPMYGKLVGATFGGLIGTLLTLGIYNLTEANLEGTIHYFDPLDAVAMAIVPAVFTFWGILIGGGALKYDTKTSLKERSEHIDDILGNK